MTMLPFFKVAYAAVAFCHAALALYSPSSPVKVLDADAFKRVKSNSELWLVEFFSSHCGHCKAFVPEFENAARALKGIVNVGAIEDGAIAGEEGIQGVPTVKLFLGKGGGAVDYKDARTASNLVSFVMKELAALARKRLGGKSTNAKNSKDKKGSPKNGDVIDLTDKTFEEAVYSDEASSWFVEFFAPWCGHCKALAPEWEEAARVLKGKVKVAKVDATVNRRLAEEFGIKGFPTLYFFPSGKKTRNSAIPYNGERTADAIVSAALELAGKAAEAMQLLSQEQFDEECGKQVCIISLIPHLVESGASGRKEYLKELNAAVKKAGTVPVKFFWAQGGDSLDFELALQLEFGYPAVVALHVNKKKFAIHRGNFKADGIRSFLTGLTSGRQKLSPLPENLPSIVTVEEWDGKDAPTLAPEPSDEL